MSKGWFPVDSRFFEGMLGILVGVVLVGFWTVPTVAEDRSPISFAEAKPFLSLLVRTTESASDLTVEVNPDPPKPETAPKPTKTGVLGFVRDQVEIAGASGRSVDFVESHHTIVAGRLSLCMTMKSTDGSDQLAFEEVQFCQEVATNRLNRLSVRNGGETDWFRYELRRPKETPGGSGTNDSG